MSLVEALHQEHLARKRRFEAAAANPKPSQRPAVREYRPVKMHRPSPVGPRKFSPAEELAWMIEIEGFLPKSDEVTIEDIQRAVCKHYGVTRNDLLSPRRTANLAFPRQVGAYLARRLTQKSFPEIGRRFGGRDHATQIYAENKIAELIKVDPAVSADVEKLVQQLGGDNDRIS